MTSDWTWGANDPGLWEWITTIAYLMAGSLCFVRARFQAGACGDSQPVFWLTAAVGMFLFGINKQLDLQTPLIAGARYAAKSLGIYSRRMLLRSLVVIFGGLVLVAVLLFLVRSSKNCCSSCIPAVAGLALLFLFVELRAAKIQNVTSVLGCDVSRIRGKGLMMELGGILLVAAGAAISVCRSALRTPGVTPATDRGGDRGAVEMS